MWNFLTTTDQRAVPQRESGRTDERAQRYFAYQWQDLALECGQVDKLAVSLFPFGELQPPLGGRGTALCGSVVPVSRVVTTAAENFDGRWPDARALELLPLEVR
jgi:hypothetical protein